MCVFQPNTEMAEYTQHLFLAWEALSGAQALRQGSGDVVLDASATLHHRCLQTQQEGLRGSASRGRRHLIEDLHAGGGAEVAHFSLGQVEELPLRTEGGGVAASEVLAARRLVAAVLVRDAGDVSLVCGF